VLRTADGPGLDRPAVEEPAQVGGQFAGRLVAPRRLLGHRPQAYRLQVARNVVVEAARRPGVVVQHLVQQHPLVALEG
jgi:hypothetical protein